MPNENEKVFNKEDVMLLGGEPKNEPVKDPQKEEDPKPASSEDVMQKMVETLDAMNKKGSKEDPDKGIQPLPTLEDLIKQNAPEVKEPLKENKIDFDDSTADEIVQHIYSEVNSKLIQPMQANINSLQLKVEVGECKLNHNDFDAYVDDIFKIGRAQPTLNVEQAYILARNNNPEKGKSFNAKSEGKKDSKSTEKVAEKLETVLEKSKSANVTPISEKSGIASPTMTAKPRTDMRGAAEEAFDELMGKQEA